MGLEGSDGQGLPQGETVNVLGESWVLNAAGVVIRHKKVASLRYPQGGSC